MSKNAEGIRNEVLRFLIRNPGATSDELEIAVTKRINKIREANQNRRVSRQRLHGHLNLMIEQKLISRDRQGQRFYYSATEAGKQLFREVVK
jgi:DNA-binding HxlR family transcriptional regulator